MNLGRKFTLARQRWPGFTWQISANTSSWRRGGGEVLPVGQACGTTAASMLSSGDPPGTACAWRHRGLAQELAPGRRATHFVSLLVTLSASGRADWAHGAAAPPLPRVAPLQRGALGSQPLQRKTQHTASATQELLRDSPGCRCTAGQEVLLLLPRQPVLFFFFISFTLCI